MESSAVIGRIVVTGDVEDESSVMLCKKVGIEHDLRDQQIVF